ncbi:MAG: ornithine carbamoyltransferase [Desulfovibrio sp.]|jgi:ornithine carbamoyltransferase|nr:ornithine carbamoyltransferase [Desulfovibrio sp.]
MQMRNVITLESLGRQTCLLLVKQVLGIKNIKSRDTVMEGRTALLVFANHSLPERLCVSAAVRQMGGVLVYEAPNPLWRTELEKFQRSLLPVFSYYVDCLYCYGLPVTDWMDNLQGLEFPIINAGCFNAHPAHVLADVACMQRIAKDVSRVTVGWIGCPNGSMHSAIVATTIFGFRLKIATPPSVDTTDIRNFASSRQASVTFVEDPRKAVAGADFVIAGYGESLDEEERKKWIVSTALLQEAAPHVKLLLGASPGRAVPVDEGLLANPASLLSRQAENRLCVHKRLLRWVFENNEVSSNA